MKKQLLLLVITYLLIIPTFGQKRSLQIGAKFINELTFANDYAWGAGAQIIYKLKGKSSIESGLYYKTRPNPFNMYPTLANFIYHIEITERNILFPVLFRFDSRFVNFTIGPVLEYYIGWKLNRKNSDVVIKDYVTDRVELISTASISKNFMITPKWIFEPEIRFSAFVPNGDGGWGLNFSFRKKIL